MGEESFDASSLAKKNKKVVEFVEDVTANADEIQDKVLVDILTKNAKVEYLNRHGLNGAIDKEAFKKKVPLISYQDIKSDIDRIVNGDKSPILCSDTISELLISSGTFGGKPKLIPITEEELSRKSIIPSIVTAHVTQYVTGLGKGKAMYFYFTRPETLTPGGLLARPILTAIYKSKHFKNRPFNPYTNYTSPMETILCPDPYQSMYSQMLCGLSQNKHVLRVGAVFASGLIHAIRFMEQNWTTLCRDIRTGTLNSSVTDPSVREAVAKILKPDPELAEFVEAECGKDSWEGIITRLWPNAKYIEGTVTGAMSQHIRTLEYYGGNLPLVSTTYSSSECSLGVNLNPLCDPGEVAYTLIPTIAYFEFLPVDEAKEMQELVDLVDVELGKDYEVVVTTYTGLYRYKVEDILRVVGFKNKAPRFKFVRRKNVILSIDADKTDEAELQNAVNNAVTAHLKPFDAYLREYTSYADTANVPGHYVLFWELSRLVESATVLEECCLAIEESLNSVYRVLRASDEIGPLEIRILEPGTFDKLMEYAVSQGVSINQYKTPRCVKSEAMIELLNSRVVSSYFSPKCPEFNGHH